LNAGRSEEKKEQKKKQFPEINRGGNRWGGEKGEENHSCRVCTGSGLLIGWVIKVLKDPCTSGGMIDKKTKRSGENQKRRDKKNGGERVRKEKRVREDRKRDRGRSRGRWGGKGKTVRK